MVSNVGTYAQAETMRVRLLEQQREINRLQVQLSTGKKTDVYSGLREEARLSVSLRVARSTNDAFIRSNTVTEQRMESIQVVLARVKDIANDMRNTAIFAMTPTSMPADGGNAAVKAQAEAALKEVIQLLNVSLDGFQLFAGREIDAKPMMDPGEVGVAGTPLDNVDSVIAVSPLANNTASGDTVYDNIVDHLDGNVVGAVAGSSPVRYYSGEYSATQESLLVARVDEGFDIDYGITGRDNSVNDILQALYALATTDLSTTTDVGYRQVVNRAAADLQTGFDGVVEEIGELGVKQSQLRDLKMRQQNTITTIELQLGQIEDVDMSTAISRLTFVQATFEASLRMVASSRELSLVRFL
jgi:flagellin-like hook-associated protein FlgL